MSNAIDGTPLLQIRVYQHGAEPYFGPGSDPGYGWLSVLANEYMLGSVDYVSGSIVEGLAAYRAKCEYIGCDRMRTPDMGQGDKVPIGLVLTPFVVPKDVGDWTTLPGDVGDWQTRTAYLNPPVTMLCQDFQGVQFDGSTVFAPWGSESDDSHPANASFAFSIRMPAVSPDYQQLVGGVPYSQIGFSGGKWAIRFFHYGPPVLLKQVGGQMVPLMGLGSPVEVPTGEGEGLIVGIVRVQRGSLMISMDNGASYDVWREPSGAPVSIPQGKYQFTGIGTAAAIGIHQVLYVDGVYNSPKRYMERSRSGSPALIRFKYSNAHNTSVATSSTAPSGSNYMRYKIELNAGSLITPRFIYYFSPDAYTVEWAWPTFPSFWWPMHDNGLTFEGRIKRCEVSFEEDLDESSCNWTARYTTTEGGILGSYAWKLIQVWGGTSYPEGHNDCEVLFTGYITGISIRQVNSLTVDVNFSASNTSIRPKRMQWRDSNATPFDGRTPNQCLLKWANSMGLDFTFLAFDTSGIGDTRVLPDIYPEEPSYVPTPGEPRWNIMQSIANNCRLDLGVANDGSYALFPQDYFVFTPYTWHANPQNNSQSFIESIEMEQMILENFTGVLARGKTPWNEQIAAWIFDGTAETNIFSSRFRPWPEWHVETVEEPTSPEWLFEIAVGISWKKITPFFAKRWKGALLPSLSRRQGVWVLGATVGAGPVAMVGVLSYKHIFDRHEGLQAWTEVVGRKLT